MQDHSIAFVLSFYASWKSLSGSLLFISKLREPGRTCFSVVYLTFINILKSILTKSLIQRYARLIIHGFCKGFETSTLLMLEVMRDILQSRYLCSNVTHTILFFQQASGTRKDLFLNGPRRLFPFRKRALPFETVDAIF